MDISINLLETSIEQYNDMVAPKLPIFTGQDVITEVIFLTPNQFTKTIKHPDTEKILIVLKGAGVIVIDNKNYDVSSGSTIFIDKGQYHQIMNGKKGKMTVYQITKTTITTEYQ